MPLFEVTEAGLQRREVARFAALGIYERADLQRMLRDDPSSLGEELLVVAEEFGQWEDARRRVDLLAVDPAGHLVVIELKRTDDGGHMELQALRYAAMVSSMGFDDVLAAFVAHRAVHPNAKMPDVDPRTELEAFLDAADATEDAGPVISTDVRIILVSANFGREITTAVLWLNRFEGMDIRCVRLVPYEVDGKVLLDIQQMNKRNAVRVLIDQLVSRGVELADIRALLKPRMFRVVPGVHESGDAVREALVEADPMIDIGRWFTDHAWADVRSNQTYVLYKMWGRNTEPALKTLSSSFPDAKVTFVAAEES